MTFEELKEFKILKLMRLDTHKFGIEVGYPFEQADQEALERLQLRGWIRLIDLSPVHFDGDKILRIFMVTPEAVQWCEKVMDHEPHA